MRLVTGTMMVVLATGLAAQTAAPAGQKWIQGKVAYIKPDNSCNCIKDAVGPGAGIGAWFTPRLGMELDVLGLSLKSRNGSVDVAERHAMVAGLYNLVPEGTWYPYLRLGVGLARIDSPYSLATGTVDKFTYHGGVGVQHFFSARGMASAEIRSTNVIGTTQNVTADTPRMAAITTRSKWHRAV